MTMVDEAKTQDRDALREYTDTVMSKAGL